MGSGISRAAGRRKVGGPSVPRHGHHAAGVDGEREGEFVATAPQKGGVDELRGACLARIQSTDEGVVAAVGVRVVGATGRREEALCGPRDGHHATGVDTQGVDPVGARS
ncbi:MAG: hypothetical protein ACE1Y4_05355, partial [Lysobacterales bacterium]